MVIFRNLIVSMLADVCFMLRKKNSLTKDHYVQFCPINISKLILCFLLTYFFNFEATSIRSFLLLAQIEIGLASTLDGIKL